LINFTETQTIDRWVKEIFSSCCRNVHTLLCSGATLINTNLLWRVHRQRKAEQKIVDDIKKKMDRIKERHIKERNKRSRELDESSPDQEQAAALHMYEPTDHYEGQSSETALSTSAMLSDV